MHDFSFWKGGMEIKFPLPVLFASINTKLIGNSKQKKNEKGRMLFLLVGF